MVYSIPHRLTWTCLCGFWVSGFTSIWDRWFCIFPCSFDGLLSDQMFVVKVRTLPKVRWKNSKIGGNQTLCKRCKLIAFFGPAEERSSCPSYFQTFIWPSSPSWPPHVCCMCRTQHALASVSMLRGSINHGQKCFPDSGACLHSNGN